VERLFGTAVHSGLEAHFLGHDGELAFMRAWRQAKQELASAGQSFGSGLAERGLELIDMVHALGISGEPERQIAAVHYAISLPFIGYADLWSEGHIWDFKTAGYNWPADKADQQIFQPAIYSQAHADEYGSIPKFTFIILPRTAGQIQLVDGTRTGQQIIDAFEKAREIHELIESSVFGCTCGKHDEEAA